MLADDFFRLTHNDATGKPRVSKRVLSIGLAGALLGELVGLQLLDVQDVLVLQNDWMPADEIQRWMIGHLRREHYLPTRDWLAFFADAAYTQVGDRLAKNGHVEARKIGLPWNRRRSYFPVNMNTAAAPEAILKTKLRRVATGYPDDFGYEDTCLAGLVMAVGLEDWLLYDAPTPGAGQYLTWAVSELYPPMLRLIEHTKAAVAGLALAYRA